MHAHEIPRAASELPRKVVYCFRSSCSVGPFLPAPFEMLPQSRIDHHRVSRCNTPRSQHLRTGLISLQIGLSLYSLPSSVTSQRSHGLQLLSHVPISPSCYTSRRCVLCTWLCIIVKVHRRRTLLLHSSYSYHRSSKSQRGSNSFCMAKTMR